MNDLDRLRVDILDLEAKTRRMAYVWENRYAQAHLKEINLMSQLMIIQLDYASLADEGGR